MFKNFLIYLFLLLFFVSCQNKSLFNQYKSIETAWDIDRSIFFKFNISDTINPYDLFIKLRTDNDYEFNNLFLDVSLIYPNNRILKDTLEYQMSQPDGSMLGSGKMSIKEHTLWYKGFNDPFKFLEKGEYKIIINHAMRKRGKVKGLQQLKGVLDVGFTIENNY